MMFKKIAILICYLVFQSLQINAQQNNSKEKSVEENTKVKVLSLIGPQLERSEEIKEFLPSN